jgi:arabinogalactan oligomer/maltooligosaccharide transport system substrate-binding protein
MRRIACLVCVVMVAVLLAACSTAEPLPLNPSTTASASAAPTPSALPASATATTAETSNPAPTITPTADTPTTVPTTAPTPSNALTLWHSFAADSTEARTLGEIVAQARQAAPGLEIAVAQIPADELSNRFETAAAAGGGPDLIFAPTTNLGRQARAGLLRELDANLTTEANQYLPSALDGMKVDNKLYGLPVSLNTMALYYNKSKLQRAPGTTGALLNAVKDGARLVLIRSTFHNFGFFGAFGGRLLDENGRCVADAGGFADALSYLRELKAAGAQFVTSGREAETLFKEGQADLTINGSWLLTDYRASLGDQLGVEPMPSGPTGRAKPLVSGSGVSINANTSKADEAVALALALTNQTAQQRYVDQSGLIPSHPNITIADSALANLMEAAKIGESYPQRPELDRFWQPFDNALAEVLENNADPVAAVQAACTAMNEANGK